MTNLYSKDAHGHIRLWAIKPDIHTFTITWGLIQGAKQSKTEFVKRNKSGRSLEEQRNLQVRSRINKQLDRGYVQDLEEAMLQKTNTLFLPRPMLAVPIDKVSNIDYQDAYVQRKYDGNRCLIANVEGQLIAYTRAGKQIPTIEHILKGILIPEGTILDGELYCHGERLQAIVSWIKRKQENTGKLLFHCYDLIDGKNKAFTQRINDLTSFQLGENAEVVPTYCCTGLDSATEMAAEFRNDGYEGAILRWGNEGYEDSKRSKHLVKIKSHRDEEFQVKDITVSKDGWGILHLEARNGLPFKATAPGTHAEKTRVATHSWEYQDKLVTIEYSNLTKDKIPFHPVAKAWRF